MLFYMINLKGSIVRRELLAPIFNIKNNASILVTFPPLFQFLNGPLYLSCFLADFVVVPHPVCQYAK